MRLSSAARRLAVALALLAISAVEARAAKVEECVLRDNILFCSGGCCSGTANGPVACGCPNPDGWQGNWSSTCSGACEYES